MAHNINSMLDYSVKHHVPLDLFTLPLLPLLSDAIPLDSAEIEAAWLINASTVGTVLIANLRRLNRMRTLDSIMYSPAGEHHVL